MADDNILRIDPRSPGADVRMMNTPDLWPLGHMLCLKRDRVADAPPFVSEDAVTYDARDELGLMVIVAGLDRWHVYRLNAMDVRLRPLLWSATIQDSVTVYEYQSAEEVFDAGWRVD